MSEAEQKGPEKGVRRGRNLPLILLLVGLAMVAFLQMPDNGKTARITYAQFQELGRQGALEDIALMHAPENIKIEGKFKTDRLEVLIREGNFSADQQKNLKERSRYKVESVPRGIVDDPDVHKEMASYVSSDKLTTPQTNDLLATFLFTIAPWLLIGAFFWFFIFRPMRQAGGAGGVLSFGRSRARLYTPEMTNITFADVAGIEEAKAEVKEIIEFLRNPQKFQKLGGRIPRGVMLIGPPGCGKTLLAKAIAGEAGVPFYAISGSDFVEMFVGVGASRVRDLFSQAKEKSPCLIFLDEIDAVGRRRGSGLGGGHDEREQTLNQILV